MKQDSKVKHLVFTFLNISTFLVGLVVFTILEYNSENFLYASYYFTLVYIIYETLFLYFSRYLLEKKEAYSLISDDRKKFYTFTGCYLNPYPLKYKNSNEIYFNKNYTFCYRKNNKAPTHYPDFLMISCEKNINQKSQLAPLKEFYLWDFKRYRIKKSIHNPAEFFQKKDASPFTFNNENEFKEHFDFKKPLKDYFIIPFCRYSVLMFLFLSFITFHFQLNYGLIMFLYFSVIIVAALLLIFMEKTLKIQVIDKLEIFNILRKNKVHHYFPDRLTSLYDFSKIDDYINLENFHSRGNKVVSFTLMAKEKNSILLPKKLRVRPNFHCLKYKYNSLDLNEDAFEISLPLSTRIGHFLAEQNIDFLEMTQEDEMLIELNFNLLEEEKYVNQN